MKKYNVKNTTRDLGYRAKESQKLQGKKYLLSSPAHLWQRTAEKENLDLLTNAFLFKGQYRDILSDSGALPFLHTLFRQH